MSTHAQQRVLPATDDVELVQRLREGDERAFEALVERYYPVMLAVARLHVRTRASAEEGFPGHWRAYPQDWRSLPEHALLGRETLQLLSQTLETLPEAQRTVVAMRDLCGCSAEEVCATLEISAANQRVLLHRGRSKL